MRQVLALELHDQVAQGLTTILIQLEELRLSRHEAAGLQAELSELQTEARRILAGVRNMLYDLRGQGKERPATDLAATVRQALACIESRSGVVCEVATGLGWPETVAPQTFHHLFRIIYEAVENAVRHGRARKIIVELEAADPGQLMVVVRDDGGGISNAGIAMPGFGIVGMRERSRLLGGDLSIISSPDGTIVSATIPSSIGG